MSLRFRLRRNWLTKTASFAAYVEADSVTTEEIAEKISVINPSITTDIIETVLESLRDVCIEELVAGNRINISNFFRITPSIKKRIESPEETIPKTSLELNGTISNSVTQAVRNDIAFERLPTEEKRPAPMICEDTFKHPNLLQGLSTLRGSNMAFDVSAEDEGVRLTNTLDEETDKPTQYASVTNSVIIFNPPELTEPTSKNNNEYQASVETRYTPGGDLRIGTCDRMLRTKKTALTADLDNYTHAGLFLSTGYELEMEESKIESATYSTGGGVFDFYIKVQTNTSGEQTAESTLSVYVGTFDDSLEVNESPAKIVVCEPDSQSIAIPCSVPNAYGVASTMTEVVIYIESLISLASLAINNYGGEVYEYFTIDDSANAPL